MAAPQKSYDLKADWDAACARYLATTGQDPRRLPVPTLQQIIAQVASTKSRDAKDHQKIDRVKDVAGKTLDCVMRLGNIAAQAASMAFGPSAICMNAISFFVDAGKSFRNIFAGLETLFTRVLDALERVEVYMKDQDLVPAEMGKMAHEMLLKFISICELSYKVLHKSNKFVMALKTAAFNDDAGVGAELEALERLETREARMGIASNVMTSRAIQRDVVTGFAKQTEDMRDVKDSMQQAKAETESDKELKYIKDQLGNLKESYRDDFKSYAGSLTPGTTEWTNDEPEIQAWLDAQNKDVSALFLVAEPGYGKSYVFSRILQNLKKQHPQGLENTSRVSIAWIYLDTKKAKVASGKDAASSSPSGSEKPSIDIVLRTLALQIAQNDPFYRKDLDSSYKQVPENSDSVQQQLRRFFLDHSRDTATFFLLIDGVDELDEEQIPLLREVLDSLLSQPGALKIKILLAGATSFMQDLATRLTSPSASIKIAGKTKSDVEKYVSARVERMDIFKNAEAQSLKEELRTGLAERVEGDFVYADFLLKQIEQKQRLPEIRLVLESAKAGGNRSDAISTEIERCNETLDAEDIRDLNVLLLWVMYGLRDFNLKQLKGILRAHEREPSLKLFKQIRDQFNTFFVVSPKRDIPGASVSLATDDIADYFEAAAKTRSEAAARKDDTNTTAIEDDHAVSEAEMRLVKNFLRTFCEPKLYDNLGFEEFFRNKTANADAIIRVPDSYNAHAEILLRLLSAINGKLGGATELVDYSIWTLGYHMSSIDDLSLVELSTKSEIGVQLIAFLRGSSGSLESFWLRNRYLWYEDDVINEVSRFLQDGAVRRRLKDEEKDWIKDHTDHENPEKDLLDPLAEQLARRWLEEKDVESVSLHFQLLFGYINKIAHAKDPSMDRADEPVWDTEKIATDSIFSIAAWASEHADSKTVDARGKFNLGVTLQDAKKFEEALEIFEEAKQAMDNKLFVSAEIAATLGCMEQYDKAISTLKPIIEALESGTNVFDSKDVKADKRRQLDRLAQWYQAADDQEAASNIYESLLNEDLGDYGSVLSAMDCLHQNKRHDKVMTHLKRMEQENDGETAERSRLEAMLSYHAELDDCHITLLNASKAAGELAYMTEQYSRTLTKLKEKVAKEQENETTFMNYSYLKASYASTLHRCCDRPEDKELAESYMRELIAIDGKEFSRDMYWQLLYTQSDCLFRLSGIYIERAGQAEARSEKATAMLAKVQDLLNHAAAEYSGYSFGPAPVRSALGRYYSKQGMLDEAREQLRENVAVGVKLLSDDDPLNDHQGYRKLANALMDFDDIENSLASWSMIRPTKAVTKGPANAGTDEKPGAANGSPATEVVAADKAAPHASPDPAAVSAATTNGTATGTNTNGTAEGGAPDAEPARPHLYRASTSAIMAPQTEKLVGPMDQYCDGRCDTTWGYASDFYVCRDCFDVQFDAACLAKLRAGTLKRHVCSKDHAFMYVPEYDADKVAKLPEGCLQVGGEVVNAEEWLDRIRKEWGIEKEQKDGEGKEGDEVAAAIAA